MKIEKHQMSTKRGKRMKGKHSGHKNNYTDNLSSKQRVKQVKIGGDAKKGCLKRTTEALIMAAQEQPIRANTIKVKIDKTQKNSKYRMCGQA